MTRQPEVATFIVRTLLESSRLRGVVERVSTGEKVRFEDADALGRIIARIVATETRHASLRREDAPTGGHHDDGIPPR